MKKLILSILLVLCLCFQSDAMSPAFLQVVSGGAPAGCGGTLTFVGNPGDTETFEYQEGDFCTTEFSETDPDGIISTYSTTVVKNGSHSLRIVTTGINQEDNFVQADFGAEDADFTVSVWYYLYDRGDYENIYIMSLGETTTPSTGPGVTIRHDGFNPGAGKITADGAVDDNSNSLTAPAWYRLEIDYNQNASSTLTIYNTSEEVVDTLTFTAYDKAPRYWSFGCIYSDEHAWEMNFDDARYKSSGGGF